MTTPAHEYLRTLTTAGHQSLIQQPETPSRRPVTATDLATAAVMVDECFLRMFMPSEVAAGMAFPSTYRWDVLNEHRPTPLEPRPRSDGR